MGPAISYITGDGLCDKSTDDCSAIVIETSGLEATFFARITKLEVTIRNIRKTCPCNVYMYPLNPHFYLVKLGFTGEFLFFFFSSKT